MKLLVKPERMVLVPLGEVERPLLDHLSAALSAVYATPVKLTPAQLEPKYAFNKDRNQYHASSVVRRLSQLRGGPSRLVPVLGITALDLFVPDEEFVIGEADRDAMAAVLSTARLKVERNGRTVVQERLRRRLEVEGVHEMGHLLGLSNCVDTRCAMYPTEDPADSDRKGPGLCGMCRAQLSLA